MSFPVSASRQQQQTQRSAPVNYYPSQQQQQQYSNQPEQPGSGAGLAVIGAASQKIAAKNPLTFFVSRENQKGLRRAVNLQNNVIWTIVASIALLTALGLLIAYGVGNSDGERNPAYLVAGLSTLLIICLPLYIITGSGFARAKRCAGSISGIAIPSGKGKVLRGLRAGQRLAGSPQQQQQQQFPRGTNYYQYPSNVNPYQNTRAGPYFQ